MLVFSGIQCSLYYGLISNVYSLWVRLSSVLRIFRAIGSCILVSRPLFRKVGGFNPQVRYAEDHAFAMEAGKAGAFGHLRSCYHFVSTRRLTKDRLFSLTLKTIFCEAHLLLLGPITHDLIHYSMDGYHKTNPDDSFPCDFQYFQTEVFRKRKVW